MSRKPILFFMFVLSSISICLAQVTSPYSPANNSIIEGASVHLKWNDQYEAGDFTLQVSPNATFDILTFDLQVESGDTLLNLPAEGKYFWRVKGNSEAQFSVVYSFTSVVLANLDGFKGWFSALNVAQGNNTPLTNWTSLADGSLATNGDPSKSPTYFSSGGVANKPYIDFLPTLHYLTTDINGADIPNDSTLSFYFLGKLRQQTRPYGLIFTLGNFSTYTPPSNNRGAYNYNTQGQFLWANNGPVTYLLQTPAKNNYKIIHGRDSKTTASLYTNNVHVGTQNATLLNVDPVSPLILGSNVDLTVSSFLETSSMLVEEFLFFNVPHDASTRTLINEYLEQRYIPLIDLGKDSLYTTFCNPHVLTIPLGYQNIQWNTGETTSSISADTTGVYWVTATSEFGDIVSDTIYIEYPLISPPSQQNICSNESVVWDAGLGSGYTYFWSTTEVSESINISTPGDYYVEVTDGLGCTKLSDTYTFIVDNYSETASLGIDTSLCQGNDIGLKIGAAETVSYLWGDSSDGTTLEINTSGQYTLEATNLNGCVLNDTINITVSGIAPTSNYSYDAACVGEVNFTDESTSDISDPIDQWEWKVNGAIVSSVDNLTYEFPSSGVFNVSLYVESLGGCGEVLSLPVTIYAPPVADFTTVSACSGDTVQFNDNSNPTGGQMITNWEWNFGQPSSGSENTATGSQAEHYFGIFGYFDVEYVVTNVQGCKDTINEPLRIYATPLPSFQFSNSCENSSINLINTSDVANPEEIDSYTWSFGDNTFSSQESPSKSYSTYGTYDIDLYVLTENGCSAIATQEIEIYPNPSVGYLIGPHCIGNYTELVSTGDVEEGFVASFDWVINGNNAEDGDTTNWQFTSLGQQVITHTVTTDKGCINTVTQFEQITESINASFSIPTATVGVDEEIIITNNSTGADGYVWDFGDGTISTDISPVHSYSEEWEDSILNLLLITSNVSGCIDSASIEIAVNEAKLDLEVVNLIYNELNGYYSFIVTLRNVGSIALQEVSLALISEQGTQIFETWEGDLYPGDHTNYLFEGKLSSSHLSVDYGGSYVCIEGYIVQPTDEEINLINNIDCKTIALDGFEIATIWPNPIVGNYLNVQLVSSGDEVVDVQLVDARGRLINLQENVEIEEGSQTLTFDVGELAEGVYTLKVFNAQLKKSVRVVIN